MGGTRSKIPNSTLQLHFVLGAIAIVAHLILFLPQTNAILSFCTRILHSKIFLEDDAKDLKKTVTILQFLLSNVICFHGFNSFGLSFFLHVKEKRHTRTATGERVSSRKTEQDSRSKLLLQYS